MAKDMNPPNSKAVVNVADDAVDVYAAAGFTPVKSEPKAAPRKSTAKK